MGTADNAQKIRLDDDVYELVRDAAYKRRVTQKQVVSEAVRAQLSSSRAVQEPNKTSQSLRTTTEHPQKTSGKSEVSSDILASDPVHAALAAILRKADPKLADAIRALLYSGAALVGHIGKTGIGKPALTGADEKERAETERLKRKKRKLERDHGTVSGDGNGDAERGKKSGSGGVL